ncbi:hypothetical protein EI94DRAFT_1730452 [Lactarius quietus]|nr:hypothetical protein EI94DRAFT_1730452 [Lactarius quietus]
MYYDHQDAGASTLLHPLNIDVATLGQPDASRSHPGGEDPHHHHNGDQGVDTFQVSVPGGASILMKDSAGTSMSLSLGIDPSSGTPILSGRAIDAHGGVLDVHPCSCNDPISPRHKLPGTPEHHRGGMHLRDHTHFYPSKSPFGAHRRLVPTPTPLIVVQTLQTPLMHSPSHPEPRSGEAEVPVQETSVDVLKSPFTPTPASMQQRRSSSPFSDPHETFHTPPMGPEGPSTPYAVQAHGSPISPLPSRDVLLTLNTVPEQSIFDPDFDAPLVQSPTSDSVHSGPSALGPLPSLPSSPSITASERTNRTVIPHSHPAYDATGGSIHLANVETMGHNELASLADTHAINPQESVIDSDSGLYTDRSVIEPLAPPSMPVPRIGSDGRELRYNLEAQRHINPAEDRPVVRSGNLEGKWVANMQQDKMALTLDLSLDGLGFQNLSLSVPPNFPLSTDQITALEVREQESAQLWERPVAVERADLWEASSESSQSVVSVGSSPSTAPPLSDLPLTPIPELLHTPTGHTMPGTGVPERPSPRASAFLSERRHPQSKIPGPLDSGTILEELAQGEGNVGTIRNALRSISRRWQNIVSMPDGVAYQVIDDACATLYHALADLAPVITLTWPPARQPSLGTDGGQPYTAEFQLRLQHMGDVERKWYLKQHEFTTSVQRTNLTRLALLAQRVREDPDAAYRGNVYERISQFAAKFQDIALRLKLAHHIRVEQKYRVRQVAAHECHKAHLIKTRAEIESIKRTLLALCDSPPQSF